MAVADGTIYEFADFRLIPKENLLLRSGEAIPMAPKSFSTLVILVENHGHLVRKEDLIEGIWAGSFVEESAVSRCIWTIRNALGEDSRSRRFIQTVPKRGYKFVANVTEFPDPIGGLAEINGNGRSTTESDSEDAKPVYASHEKPAARVRIRAWQVFSVITLAVLAIGSTFVYLASPGSPVAPAGTISIAVLPFHPINTSNRDEMYDLGMADVLINRLSTIEDFQVRSLSSVRRYVDLETDATAAGREQKVDYVLASRYQVDGGKIRITSQLINIGTGKIVESYDFLKDVPDAFTAQEAVSFELKDRLAARFGNSEAGKSSERGTNNEEAYRLFLLAQNFNELRGPENGRMALEQIDRAVTLDPNFARAWATKAYIHRYMGYGAAAIEHSMKSVEAVEKAIALDPNLSEAHSVRCFNKFRFEYDYVGAERACKRAIELDPESPLAHKLYSNFLYTRGRFDDSLAEIKKAIDLQPVSYDNQQTYALALYFARRYADSEAQWKQLIPLNPNHNLIYGHLVKSLVRQRKEAEAYGYLIKSLTLEKANDETIQRFRNAFANTGWPGVIRERIKLVERRENPPTYELARLYASTNDKDNAFKFLERAYRERSNMIAVVGVDPELDSLRTDPRYAELLQKVEAN